jgi:hypothetical protein
VAHEDIVFDGDPFADEGVAGDLAVFTNPGVFLDFYESTDLGVVSNRATV